jgi:hypothetical protein
VSLEAVPCPCRAPIFEHPPEAGLVQMDFSPNDPRDFIEGFVEELGTKWNPSPQDASHSLPFNPPWSAISAPRLIVQVSGACQQEIRGTQRRSIT